MKERKEVREANDVKEVKEQERDVAAFFDLDGTLTALPSLERRFLRVLRYRREIPSRNYFLWLREALRLLPRGINAILQANKMYLRGVHILDECGERDRLVSSWHKGGHQAEGQASAQPSKETSKRARCDPRLPVPAFLTPAVERVAWHAKQGHAIVLLSGTLEPLARGAAHAIEARLVECGITAKICVCATRLEEKNGKWTGRILGGAMFGEAKASAARLLAKEMQLDLEQSYAYGDSLNDRWLLEVVGKPAAVNPSLELARIAKRRGWALLRWNKETESIQRTQGREENNQDQSPCGALRKERQTFLTAQEG